MAMRPARALAADHRAGPELLGIGRRQEPLLLGIGLLDAEQAYQRKRIYE